VLGDAFVIFAVSGRDLEPSSTHPPPLCSQGRQKTYYSKDFKTSRDQGTETLPLS